MEKEFKEEKLEEGEIEKMAKGRKRTKRKNFSPEIDGYGLIILILGLSMFILSQDKTTTSVGLGTIILGFLLLLRRLIR